MKFKEFVKNFAPKSEDDAVKKICSKLEEQYYNACENAGLNPEVAHPEVTLEVYGESQVQMLYFKVEEKRISMYMFFVPTGDLILTNTPENYMPISAQKFGLN